MPARSFFDTNVLAYTDDHDSPTKQSRALALFEEARRTGAGVVSTQVMQEYFVTVTRKLGVPVDVARRKVELFARLGLVVIDLADVLAAIDLHRLHQIAFWDAPGCSGCAESQLLGSLHGGYAARPSNRRALHSESLSVSGLTCYRMLHDAAVSGDEVES